MDLSIKTWTRAHVFQSGNILLHEHSNSNYCVSQPFPLWARLKPAGKKLAAPGAYFLAGLSLTHKNCLEYDYAQTVKDGEGWIIY